MTVNTPFQRRSFLKGSLIGVGGLLFGGGVLSACSTNSQSADGASNGDNVQDFEFLSYLPMETLSMAPEMYGLAAGKFLDENLNVTVQEVQGSPQALQTLISGVAPLTRVGGIDVITARSQGQPLVVVGTIVHEPSLRINYSKESPLERPEDFEGKTIGIPSEGGTSEKTLILMLANNGIDPDSVTRQVVAQTPASFEMVKQGRLDGYMASMDTGFMLQYQDDLAEWFNPADFSAIESDTQAYVTTEEALETYGDQIQNYLAAVRTGVQEIAADADRSASIETLRQDYSFGTLDNDEVARNSLDAAVNLWTKSGEVEDLLVTDVDRWVRGVEELAQNNLIEGFGGDPTEWVTNSLV